MTNDVFVELLYERRLPKVYRDYDREKAQLALKRYLQALTDGGFGLVLTDVEESLYLIDPELCPDEYVPFLIKSFGLPYYPDIDLKYQRRVLANIGGLVKRRGTYAGVRFLSKILSGMECDLEYFRGYHLEKYGRYLVITLLAMTTEQIRDMEISAYLMSRYVKEILPYYIHVIIKAVVAMQTIVLSRIRHTGITQHSWHDLRSYKK